MPNESQATQAPFLKQDADALRDMANELPELTEYWRYVLRSVAEKIEASLVTPLATLDSDTVRALQFIYRKCDFFDSGSSFGPYRSDEMDAALEKFCALIPADSPARDA